MVLWQGVVGVRALPAGTASVEERDPGCTGNPLRRASCFWDQGGTGASGESGGFGEGIRFDLTPSAATT